MSKDPAVYSEAHLFKPERYAEENAPDPKQFVFGWGRRACPGALFADLNVWLVAASLAAAFNVSKAIGEDGKEITPDCEFISTLVRYVHSLVLQSNPITTRLISSHPKPFKCSIQPRDEMAARLISQAAINRR